MAIQFSDSSQQKHPHPTVARNHRLSAALYATRQRAEAATESPALPRRCRAGSRVVVSGRPFPHLGAMTTEPKGRILVIDDDDAVRSAYERLLSHAGYDVRAASSPYEGLESVGDWKPDVILLDLAMPTISGFEGAKVFKKKPATRDAILVAFSGMISDDEVTRFRRIGFDEVLPKPVAAIMIVERIESFLARRAASRQDV